MRSSLILVGLLLGSGPAWAQSCEQIKLATDTQKRKLLRDYITDCYQRHLFFGGKGAVKLVAYQDGEGRPCWLLSAIVDDRYQAAPPAQYAHFGKNIILVYQGNSQGRALPAAGDAAARAACLQEVLGSRVYHYKEEPQYTIDTDAPGGPRKIKVTHVFGGSPDNDLLIKFSKDGTITKFRPV